MIISSSCIGMDSVRNFNSVRMDAYAEGTGNGGIGNFLSSLRDAKSSLSANDETDEAEKEGSENAKADELSETLEDIRSKYDFLKTNNSLSSKLEQDAISKIKTQCLQYLLRMILGYKSALDEDGMTWEDFTASYGSSEVSFSSGISTITESFTSVHYYEESEETSFMTTGSVITADGRTFDFNLELSMSRSFSEYYENTIETSYVMCDPLVINLDCDIAGVSDVKFRFDLDADGNDDSVSILSSGSAFLALDINEDGIINDGSELFGTKSGNGFKDLSAYDLDKNGWIDEADEVFKKLKIFSVDEEGNQTLLSLSDKDIGAIYLGNVSTNFYLKSGDDNHTNGAIRSTGLFLYENGAVGSVQHVDLAKTEYTA